MESEQSNAMSSLGSFEEAVVKSFRKDLGDCCLFTLRKVAQIEDKSLQRKALNSFLETNTSKTNLVTEDQAAKKIKAAVPIFLASCLEHSIFLEDHKSPVYLSSGQIFNKTKWEQEEFERFFGDTEFILIKTVSDELYIFVNPEVTPYGDKSWPKHQRTNINSFVVPSLRLDANDRLSTKVKIKASHTFCLENFTEKFTQFAEPFKDPLNEELSKKRLKENVPLISVKICEELKYTKPPTGLQNDVFHMSDQNAKAMGMGLSNLEGGFLGLKPKDSIKLILQLKQRLTSNSQEKSQFILGKHGLALSQEVRHFKDESGVAKPDPEAISKEKEAFITSELTPLMDFAKCSMETLEEGEFESVIAESFYAIHEDAITKLYPDISDPALKDDSGFSKYEILALENWNHYLGRNLSKLFQIENVDDDEICYVQHPDDFDDGEKMLKTLSMMTKLYNQFYSSDNNKIPSMQRIYPYIHDIQFINKFLEIQGLNFSESTLREHHRTSGFTYLIKLCCINTVIAGQGLPIPLTRKITPVEFLDLLSSHVGFLDKYIDRAEQIRKQGKLDANFRSHTPSSCASSDSEEEEVDSDTFSSCSNTDSDTFSSCSNTDSDTFSSCSNTDSEEKNNPGTTVTNSISVIILLASVNGVSLQEPSSEISGDAVLSAAAEEEAIRMAAVD